MMKRSTCHLGLIAGIGVTLAACSSADYADDSQPEAPAATSAELTMVPGSKVPLGLALAVDPKESEPLENRIVSGEFAEGKLLSAGIADIPEGAFRTELADYAKPKEFVPKLEHVSIDELLEARLRKAEAAGKLDGATEVVVTFKETLRVPRFPEALESEPRDSKTNAASLASAAQLVQSIEKTRAAEHARHEQVLRERYGAKVTDTFWLINGLTAVVPLSQVRALAAQSDVEFVEENYKAIPPPSGNLAGARGSLVTDPYFNLGQTSGFIGLLDTGVRATHTLLTRVDFKRDCVNGTSSNCTVGSGLDPSDNFWNHGTSSASLISGNANLGNANRGVSGITVDSWKIYNNSGLVTAAAVRGFQAAVAVLDRVIVAEIQDTGSATASIAAAADAAFNAGAVVVAAAGNFGSSSGSIRSPGNARKALAIGAVEFPSLTLKSYSGRGPTADGRYKPDLTSVTDITAASNVSDTALQTFTGTSCATPIAGGATALVRNFLRGTNFSISPGLVNSFMILTGRSGTFNNNEGAGLIQLPTNGTFNLGSVTMNSGTVIDIPLSITGSISSLDVALWWPETAALHNDVDVSLLNPSGATVASSVSSVSIFERIHVNTTAAGTWKVRVRSFNVSASQPVFWSLVRRF